MAPRDFLRGSLIRALHSFPVNRGTPDRAAIRKSVEVLQSGEALVMFPEGECSETGDPLPLLPGAALIIRMADVPVVCCGIVGTRKIMPYGKLIPRPSFGGVSATFGKPRAFEKNATQDEILGWVRSQFDELTR